MRKLFVSTTHWLADATVASVPSAAKASRRRALLQPDILGDVPAQTPVTQNASQVASWAVQALLRSCQQLQQARQAPAVPPAQQHTLRKLLRCNRGAQQVPLAQPSCSLFPVQAAAGRQAVAAFLLCYPGSHKRARAAGQDRSS